MEDLSYLDTESFMYKFLLDPDVTQLENVTRNEFLITDEKEQRILKCLDLITPSDSLFLSSLYTAPRVFWRLYLENPVKGNYFLGLEFTSMEYEKIACYVSSVFFCLGEKSYKFLDRVFREKLLAVERVDYEKKKYVVQFAEKYI